MLLVFLTRRYHLTSVNRIEIVGLIFIWGFATFSLSCSKYYCSKLICHLQGLNRRPLDYKGNALAVTPRRWCFIGHPYSIDFRGRQLYLQNNLMVGGGPPQVDGERRPLQLTVRGGPSSWWWEAAPNFTLSVDGERRPLQLMVRGGPFSWQWEAAPFLPNQLTVRGGPSSWWWEAAPFLPLGWWWEAAHPLMSLLARGFNLLKFTT